MPALRQAVIAARDLDGVVGQLGSELSLGEPFHDEAVGYFGLRNAVFALTDTFIEVVSPIREDASAARLLARRGGDCGYMLMFQVADLNSARQRAREAGVREVFEVDLPDMREVHLHPADMTGAIVSLSEPQPAASWRWGGPNWESRARGELRVAGATVAVPGSGGVSEQWQRIIGEPAGVRFEEADHDRGVVEIVLAGRSRGESLEIGGIRISFIEEDRQ